MGGFEIDIDVKKFRAGLFETSYGYRAVRETIRVQGVGETITSRRKKEKWEKKRAKHGRFISWYFRRKGIDLFIPNGRAFQAIQDQYIANIDDALTLADKTGKPQPSMIRDALRWAAQEWAEAVQDKIKSGGLGRNVDKVRQRKTMMVKMGMLPDKYGTPPPRGISTGRYVEGIRGRWRQGRL